MDDPLLEKLKEIQRKRLGEGLMPKGDPRDRLSLNEQLKAMSEALNLPSDFDPRPDGSIQSKSFMDSVNKMGGSFDQMPKGLSLPDMPEVRSRTYSPREFSNERMMDLEDGFNGGGGSNFVEGNPRGDRLSALPPVEPPRQVGHPQRSVGSMSFDDISGGLKDSTLDMLPRLNRGANSYIGHDISAGPPQNYDKSLGALNRSGSKQGYGYSQTINADGQMRFATPPGVGSIHAPGLNRSTKGLAFDRRETDPLTRGQEAAARYGLTELGVNEGIKTDAALQNHFTPHSNVDPTQDSREAQTWDAMINREPNMANRGVTDYARNRHFGGEVLQRGYASASQPQMQSGPTAVAGINPPAPQPATRPQGPMSLTAYAGMPSQNVGSRPPQLDRAGTISQPDFSLRSTIGGPPPMAQSVPPPASVQATLVSEAPMAVDPGQVAMLDVTRSQLPPVQAPAPSAPPPTQGAFASGPPPSVSSVPPPPTLPPVEPQMTFQRNPSLPQVQATTPGFNQMMPQVARSPSVPPSANQPAPIESSTIRSPSESITAMDMPKGGFESMTAQSLPGLDAAPSPSRLAQFSPPQGAFASTPPAAPPSPPTPPTVAPQIAAAPPPPPAPPTPPAPAGGGLFGVQTTGVQTPSIPSGGMGGGMGGFGGGGGIGGLLGGLGGIASAIAGEQQAKAQAAQQQNAEVDKKAKEANSQALDQYNKEQARVAQWAQQMQQYWQEQQRRRMAGL